MLKILLACGAGCSSGFIASNMRKSAKQKGLEVEIKAVSDADILTYADNYDILLIGPHIAYKVPDIERTLQNKAILISLITQRDYGSLNGEAVLAQAIELTSGSK